MRKILFSIILGVLVILTILLIVNGVSFKNSEVYGVRKIQEENDNIDTKNSQLFTLVSQGYPEAAAKVEAASKEMQDTKEQYEEKAKLLGDSKYYMQTEEYKIEFLWTKLGNYANDENVEIKIDVSNSSLSGRYNLNFEVVGKYTDVTQFIYDVENDSKLGFKIENFNMKSAEISTSTTEEKTNTTYGVIGKFSCKDIRIDIGTTANSKAVSDNINDATNTESTNTTNTTNTTNATSNTVENTANSTSDGSTEADDVPELLEN